MTSHSTGSIAAASTAASTSSAAVDSFSKLLAFRHGIVHALILGRVAAFCPDFESYGEPCVTITQANLAKTFPYLREGAVIKAIHKLAEKGLLLHKPRQRSCNHPNKARWSYSVPKDVWKAAQHKLQYFKIEDAVAYGYREAILLWVLEERLAAARAADPTVTGVEMSPTALARTVPIGISAISQKLKRLVEKGVIVKTVTKDWLAAHCLK